MGAIVLWRCAAEADAPLQAEAQDRLSKPRSGSAGRTTTLGTKPALRALSLWNDLNASVAGTVLSERNRPIVGALVCATPTAGEVPTSVLRSICVTTDEAGDYVVRGLAALPYRVNASAPGYIPAHYTSHELEDRIELPLGRGQHKDGLDIILRSGGVEVRGTVRDLVGGTIEGALVLGGPVSASPRHFLPHGTARSDDAGRFSLWVAPGDIVVVASADGYADALKLGRVPGQEFALSLTPESVLVGRVVDRDGKGIQGARVTASGRRGAIAFSNEDGGFRVEGLYPGRYKPTASTTAAWGEAANSVHLGLGESSQVTIVVHPSAAVLGTIVIAQEQRGCPRGHAVLTSSSGGGEYLAQTQAEGAVEFRGVRPGDYTVTIMCYGYLAAAEYPRVSAGESRVEGLSWDVSAGQAIRGRVVDDAGRSATVAGVSGTLVDGGRELVQWTDDIGHDGSFELRGLAAGEYLLMAASRQHAAPVPPPSVTLAAGVDLEGVEIRMSAAGSIRGRVEDERGDPVAGVEVNALNIAGVGATARVADDGSFEVAGLAEGSYRVWAHATWRTLRTPGSTDDSTQGTLVEVVVDELAEVTLVVEARDGEIAGVVVDDSGVSVADAFIRAERESDSIAAAPTKALSTSRWAGLDETPVLTDEDGAFVVTNLSAGRYTIWAYRRGGGEGFVQRVGVDATGVLVSITTTGSLSGVIRGADDVGLEQFRITAHVRDSGFERGESFSRTGGKWTLEQLPAGRYELSVEADAGTGMGRATLKAGQQRRGVNIEIAARVTVLGQLIDALSEQPVAGLTVRIGPRGSGQAVTDRRGMFEIEGVAAGRTRLAVVVAQGGQSEQGGYRPMVRGITVAALGPVELPPIKVAPDRVSPGETVGSFGLRFAEPKPGRQRYETPLVVGPVRPGGPAAHAGLVPGDRIRSIDGHDVTGSSRYLYEGLTRVPVGTVVRVWVTGKGWLKMVAGEP